MIVAPTLVDLQIQELDGKNIFLPLVNFKESTMLLECGLDHPKSLKNMRQTIPDNKEYVVVASPIMNYAERGEGINPLAFHTIEETQVSDDQCPRIHYELLHSAVGKQVAGGRNDSEAQLEIHGVGESG